MKKNKGFSLTEVMIVLLLLLIIAGMIAPRIRSVFEGISMDAAVRQVASAMKFARQSAIRTRSVTILDIIEDHEMRVRYGFTERRFGVPEGISLSDARIAFYPRGTCDEAMVFIRSIDIERIVNLNPLGRITIDDETNAGGIVCCTLLE